MMSISLVQNINTIQVQITRNHRNVPCVATQKYMLNSWARRYKAMTFSHCHRKVSKNDSNRFVSRLSFLGKFACMCGCALEISYLSPQQLGKSYYFNVSIFFSALKFSFSRAEDKVEKKTKMLAVLFYIFIKDLMMQHFRFNMLFQYFINHSLFVSFRLLLFVFFLFAFLFQVS